MDFTDYRPFVIGWGNTQEAGKRARILQELQLPVQSNQKCIERYSAMGKLLSEKQFDNATMCVGQLRGGFDTCQGKHNCFVVVFYSNIFHLKARLLKKTIFLYLMYR